MIVLSILNGQVMSGMAQRIPFKMMKVLTCELNHLLCTNGALSVATIHL